MCLSIYEFCRSSQLRSQPSVPDILSSRMNRLIVCIRLLNLASYKTVEKPGVFLFLDYATLIITSEK